MSFIYLFLERLKDIDGNIAAAWAQVVAVAVGLFVAILIPWQQRRNELKDRKERIADEATGLALALLPILEEYCKRLQRAVFNAERCEETRAEGQPEKIWRDQEYAVWEVRTAANDLEPFTQRLEYLYKLGPLAHGVHDLIHLSRTVARDFKLDDDSERVPNVYPLDIPRVRAAVQGAGVLKARAFAVRDEFSDFLSQRFSGDLRPYYKKSRHYQW